jgi:hypothetical protein
MLVPFDIDLTLYFGFKCDKIEGRELKNSLKQQFLPVFLNLVTFNTFLLV